MAKEPDQWKADWEHLMKQDEFRRVLWATLQRCGVNRHSFTGNSKTFFREGERNIGLWLESEAKNFDRNNFINMIKENLE